MLFPFLLSLRLLSLCFGIMAELCTGEEKEEEVVVVYSRHCSGSIEWAR
jgi:hypothetical protein